MAADKAVRIPLPDKRIYCLNVYFNEIFTAHTGFIIDADYKNAAVGVVKASQGPQYCWCTGVASRSVPASLVIKKVAFVLNELGTIIAK